MGEQGHETQREQEQILSQFPGFQPENEAEESFLARLLFVILLPPALFFKEINLESQIRTLTTGESRCLFCFGARCYNPAIVRNVRESQQPEQGTGQLGPN